MMNESREFPVKSYRNPLVRRKVNGDSLSIKKTIIARMN